MSINLDKFCQVHRLKNVYHCFTCRKPKAQGGNIPTAPYRGMGEPGPGVCPLAPDPALLPTTLLAPDPALLPTTLLAPDPALLPTTLLAPDPALLPTTLLAQGVSQNVALVQRTELYRDFYKMILEQVLNISL